MISHRLVRIDVKATQGFCLLFGVISHCLAFSSLVRLRMGRYPWNTPQAPCPPDPLDPEVPCSPEAQKFLTSEPRGCAAQRRRTRRGAAARRRSAPCAAAALDGDDPGFPGAGFLAGTWLKEGNSLFLLARRFGEGRVALKKP